jgi:hypothetical protein
MRSPCTQKQIADECDEEQDEREAMPLVHHPLRLKVRLSHVVDFSLSQGLHQVEGWVGVVGIKGDGWIYQILSGWRSFFQRSLPS